MASLTPTQTVYRGVSIALWVLMLWNCWWSRGLFVDGYSQLVGILRLGGYDLFYGPRAHLMTLTQTPTVVALWLGVTNSETLAQLLSVGLFGVPTLFYWAALHRSRRDPVLLAAVICTMGLAFVPTSFFIIGEHNSVCAMTIFTVAVLATGPRLTRTDGWLLLLTAAILLRSYELMVLMGPLLALLIVWRTVTLDWRSAPAALYFVAAGLLLWSAVISFQSVGNFHDKEQVNAALGAMFNFAQNLQFILPLVAVVILFVAGLVWPRLLERRALYIGAGVLLAVEALTPLLWLLGGNARPYPKAHYETRIAALAVTAAIALAMFVYACAPSLIARLRVFARPEVARRVLLFQLAVFGVSVPADVLLTELWRRSIVAFQQTIAAGKGEFIAVEETPLAGEPYRHFVENWTLPMQSLIVRHQQHDSIVLPSKDFRGWQQYEPTAELPGLFRYYWGGGDGGI